MAEIEKYKVKGKIERIVCAAIEYRAWDFSQEEYRPEPFHICGVTYESIMASDAFVQCCVLRSATRERKGFMTSHHRFVDPIQALIVATHSDPIIAAKWSYQIDFTNPDGSIRNFLLPEDLD